MMTIDSATGDAARAVFDTVADRDDARASLDTADLTVVFLVAALGLSLTAVFFGLGFGVEIGQILAASG